MADVTNREIGAIIYFENGKHRLVHYGRKGMKWDENIFEKEEEKKGRGMSKTEALSKVKDKLKTKLGEVKTKATNLKEDFKKGVELERKMVSRAVRDKEIKKEREATDKKEGQDLTSELFKIGSKHQLQQAKKSITRTGEDFADSVHNTISVLTGESRSERVKRNLKKKLKRTVEDQVQKYKDFGTAVTPIAKYAKNAIKKSITRSAQDITTSIKDKMEDTKPVAKEKLESVKSSVSDFLKKAKNKAGKIKASLKD